MSIWAIIKNLKFSQVWHLFTWFLRHPIFMLASVIATFYTLKIAQREFPDIHDQHNRANAFRHALWNFLIANQCSIFSSDLNKILDWAKKITDWHEEFSPNKEMAKLMDLHNNAIGRNRFADFGKNPRNEIVKILKEEVLIARQVNNKSDFQKFKNQLVYLEE